MLFSPDSSFFSILQLLFRFVSFVLANPEDSIAAGDRLQSRGLEKRDRTWNRQIRCIGPMFGGVTEAMTGGPTQFSTARKFCAAQDYGGLPMYNMGGFCDRFHGRPVVAFSKLPGEELGIPPLEEPSSPWLAQRRFYDKSLAFCFQRCRCIRDQAQPGQGRLWPALEILTSEQEQASSFYDRNPGFYVVSDPTPFGVPGERYIKVPVAQEATYQTRGIRLWTISSRTDHEAPRCLNLRPALYPEPFRRSNFAVAQELCASVLHGGSLQGNAGAVCHFIPGTTSISPRFQLKLLDYLSQYALVFSSFF
jgi:hypothetical protein